ncbi:MAG: Sec-independent protein translocase protein TatB [Silicimonas sp.]|nr:Sec-independent protein translocase protein TatB [Silicimonas sp.]
MFDLGWSELLVIGIVVLIVIGPKDLPGMFRQLGKYTAKIRRMARDFQRAMEDAADEAGVKETASSLKKMTSAKEMGLDAVKDAAKGWDPTKPSKKAKDIGPETSKLSEERAEQARKIRENSARKAQERLDAEKAAAEASEAETAPVDPPEAKSGDA